VFIRKTIPTFIERLSTLIDRSKSISTQYDDKHSILNKTKKKLLENLKNSYRYEAPYNLNFFLFFNIENMQKEFRLFER